MTTTTKRRNRLAQMPLLPLILLLLTPAGAQELTRLQQVEVADCALHRDGGWVDSNLYEKGRVRFSYISEHDFDATDEKDPRNIYIAFWNRSRTAGELLVFRFHKNHRGKDFFVLDNQGDIVKVHGQLDVRDALWGMWTHRKLQGLLPRLQRRPLAVLKANQTKPGPSICKTPFDYGDVNNWPR